MIGRASITSMMVKPQGGDQGATCYFYQGLAHINHLNVESEAAWKICNHTLKPIEQSNMIWSNQL